MSERPRISIAMGSYNGARFIYEQLLSLADQETLPYELIISDDGSVDDTCQIVNSFSKKAPFPVTLIKQPSNLGFADNFLAAGLRCTGEYIAFCDQDDVWLRGKLTVASERIRADDCHLFVHQSMMTDVDLHKLRLLDLRLPPQGVFDPCSLDVFGRGFGHCMVFKRNLLAIGRLSERPFQPGTKAPISHDHWVMQLASLFGKISISEEPLVLYRQHGSNLFGAGTPNVVTADSFGKPDLVEYKKAAQFYKHLERYLSDAFSKIDKPEGVSGADNHDVLREIEYRHQRLFSRIATYTERRVSSRAFAAWQALKCGLRIKGIQNRRLLASTIKDVVFGVAHSPWSF